MGYLLPPEAYHDPDWYEREQRASQIADVDPGQWGLLPVGWARGTGWCS